MRCIFFGACDQISSGACINAQVLRNSSSAEEESGEDLEDDASEDDEGEDSCKTIIPVSQLAAGVWRKG